MLPNPPLSHQRAAIARAEKFLKRRPDDPTLTALVARARADYQASLLEHHAQQIADAAPRLSRDQLAHLAVLLLPVINGAALPRAVGE